MARRSRSYSREYAPDLSGLNSFQFNGNNPSVIAAIVYTILLTIVLGVIAMFLGPVADYFSNFLMSQPGNPYATPVLMLFSWWYILILASWVVGVILVWRAVFFNITFERG
jgi:hypothetical protein